MVNFKPSTTTDRIRLAQSLTALILGASEVEVTFEPITRPILIDQAIEPVAVEKIGNTIILRILE